MVDGGDAIAVLNARGHLHDAEILEFAFDPKTGCLDLTVEADPETPCEIPSRDRFRIVLSGVPQQAHLDTDPGRYIGYGIVRLDVDVQTGRFFLSTSVCGMSGTFRTVSLAQI